MTSIIKSISVSQEENDFLQDYNLSPSQLIKEKIWEMRGIIKNITGNKIEKLVAKVEQLSIENENLKNVLEQRKTWRKAPKDSDGVEGEPRKSGD